MANTSVTYTADGMTSNFTFSFPYILASHVKVYKNNQLQDLLADYTITSGNTVNFQIRPIVNDVIVIKRDTSTSGRLVDYQSGAVLTEAELDLDSTQAFYLAQEIREDYADLLFTAKANLATQLGVPATDPDTITDELVQNILADDLAQELQDRITDIDTNAQNVISVISDVNDLEARYGVTLNVNGYITGFEQFNDGTSGTFAIMADNFYIVDPANGGQNPVIPFAVSGGIVSMQNVSISGDLVSAGTIQASAFRTASSPNQRVEINVGSSNEIEFFADRGDGTVASVATIGVTTYGSDNVIGYFGDPTDINYSEVAVAALSYGNIGLTAFSGIGGSYGVYSISEATTGSAAGVNGIGNATNGNAIGGKFEGYGNGAVGCQGEAGADTGGYGVYGLHQASVTTLQAGYGGYFEHKEPGGIPLLIKPDSADVDPKTSGNSAGSIWVPAGGGEIMAYISDDWTTVAAAWQHADTSAGGTSIPFTDVPDGCNQIEIVLGSIGTNGSSRPGIEVGTGATPTYKTSGYTSTIGEIDGSTTAATSTGKIVLVDNWASGHAGGWEIRMHRVKPSTDEWDVSIVGHRASSSRTWAGGCGFTLGASTPMTAWRLIANGTDTIDTTGYIMYRYSR